MCFRFVTVLLPVLLVHHVTGHGRLIVPPSRSSMWREGFDNPKNYGDNQLFCGGFSIQWGKNGGKCGVCGDRYDGPRDNEAPDGKYANGLIVRKYDIGDVIDVVVHLTANHKGTFEFKLCQNDRPDATVTPECFDQHVLSSTGGVTLFPIESGIAKYQKFRMQLPKGLKCRACVLQWKYNTGNSWGKDLLTGEGCIGCGPQEQFYGCSDIAIGYTDVKLGRKTGEPVVIPAGDVDETKWEDNMKQDKQSGNNCCPCNMSAASGAHTGHIVIVMMGLTAMLGM